MSYLQPISNNEASRSHYVSTRYYYDDGNVVCHTGFYPYGQPWRRPGERQWLYGGKEWLGADGRDEYDFHARRQYPHLAMFTTPDPHADSYHDLSPYTYCAGNPIMFIDPTGENTYRIDPNGQLHLLYEDDNEKDVIYNDNLDASIEVNKEFMASKHSVTKTVHRYSDNSDVESNMDIFTTFDNTNELFRFLTDNTDVEWSQIISNESGKIVNRLGTSHNPNGDGSAYYISLFMIKTENSIIECNHCHNSLIQYPSQGDVELAKLVKAKHPNATFRIIHQFYRYPDTIFDENTPYTKRELDEIIVRPKDL